MAAAEDMSKSTDWEYCSLESRVNAFKIAASTVSQIL